jgi:quinol monooxygenase YgiN
VEVIEMSFVQVVEYQTDRPAEMRRISEEWTREHPSPGPARVTLAEDRDRPGHFIMVAEFDSYEQAMTHSGRPETGEYAERMRQLASADPRYVNLEVAHRQV